MTPVYLHLVPPESRQLSQEKELPFDNRTRGPAGVAVRRMGHREERSQGPAFWERQLIHISHTRLRHFASIS